MAESIDELQIEITASSDKASQSIDKLCKNMEKLKAGIASIDASGFTNSMKTITDSLKGLSNIKISGFSSFAKNINQLGNMDNSKIVQMSTAIKEFGNSVQSLGSINVSDDVAKMSELARSISRLGTSAAGKAVTNMPQLASALNSMMAQLQKAPKVSQNLIDMTNALANFARTGSSGGRAATSLGNSVKNMSGKFSGVPATLKRFDSAISKSVGKIKSFKSSILSAFGAVGGIYAAINGIKQSIAIASDLTEVQNVVDVTFGNFKDKIESLAAMSIPELGMSELTAKQIASRFQAMGTAMGIARGEMADMSVDLTRLAGDMSSFYNVAQEDVARSLQAVFTGETEPLRKYGLDLTQATLKEWSLKNGIDADIKSMSQMEKTMLRYQYVMANTTAAQGDFIRTADTWANQVRILKEQLKQLAGVLGTAFINALKPLVSALNSALSSIISFAQTVVNALGKIFGWKIKISNSGIASDFDSAASGADDIAGSTGKAAKNVDKMKAGLRAFDELKTIDTSGKDSGSGGGGGAGSAGGAGAGAGDLFQLEETESAFKSKIKDLEGLGEYIGNALQKAMEGINWDGVYEKASEFGSGLAQFLNGLISPELFADLGTTVAGAINTALHALDSFGETFDWENFGKSLASGLVSFLQGIDWETALSAASNWGEGIATALNNFISPETFGTVGETISQALNTAVQFALDLGQKFDFYNFGASVATGINNFFKTFDFGTLAETLNTWVDGLEDAIAGFLKTVKWSDILKKVGTFLGDLELDTIAVIIGALLLKNKSKSIIGASWLAGQIATKLGISSGTLTLYTGLTISVGVITYELASHARGWVDSLKKWWNETSVGSSHVGYDESGNEIEVHLSLKATIDRYRTEFKKKTNDKFLEFKAKIKTKAKDLWNNLKIEWDNIKGKVVEFKIKIKDKAKDLWDGFHRSWDGVKNKVVNFKTKIESKASDLWSNFKKSWGESKTAHFLLKISSKTSELWSSFKKSWGESKTANFLLKINTKASELWSDFKDRWGTSKKVSIGIGFGSNALSNLWNSVTNFFSGKSVKIGASSTQKADGGVFSNGSWKPIQRYAAGGIPDYGQLFWAREAGPELVGTLGGSTAVMNNDQIVASVADGVYKAVKAAMGNGQSVNVTFKVEGDPKGIFKVTRSEAQDFFNRTGKPAFPM